MTHSFLLAFCHLHIILHFFSRSPPLPASILSSFLPQSFNPSFTLSPSLSVFSFSLSLSFFTTSFCSLLAYTYFLAYSFSFPFVLSATLDDEKNFILETLGQHLFSPWKKKENVILIPGYSNSNSFHHTFCICKSSIISAIFAH